MFLIESLYWFIVPCFYFRGRADAVQQTACVPMIVAIIVFSALSVFLYTPERNLAPAYQTFGDSQNLGREGNVNHEPQFVRAFGEMPPAGVPIVGELIDARALAQETFGPPEDSRQPALLEFPQRGTGERISR